MPSASFWTLVPPPPRRHRGRPTACRTSTPSSRVTTGETSGMPELLLLLGDEVAGTVTRLPGGKLTFTYDAKYADEHVPATPVSVSMPPQIASHTDTRVAPW